MTVSTGHTTHDYSNMDNGINLNDIKHDIENISPKTAREYLKHNLGQNRLLRKSSIDEYAGYMMNGDWQLSPDCIAFDITGSLINGQHRLYAVIESGCTILFLVIRGMPLDTFGITDAGRKRKAADALFVRGYKNSAKIATMIQTLICFDRGCAPGIVSGDKLMGINKISVTDILRYAESDPEIIDSFDCVKGYKNGLYGMCSISFAAFYYHIYRRIDEARAREFIRCFSTGERLSVGNPVLALRSYLIKNITSEKKLLRTRRLSYITVAGNAFMKHEHLRRIKSSGDRLAMPIDRI